MKSFFLVLLTFANLFCASPIIAKTVRYELEATKNTINLSGKQHVNFALMINGKIPAPALEFTEGDDAEITVKNRIPNEELSIHWHGILLPTEMDGVPYVNTPPINSGEDFTFRFKIRQHGTYWYHSHTNVQEQKGLYGAFIIHKKEKSPSLKKDVVAVISDWSDENAVNILSNLRKDGDFYLYKKGTIRSWFGAIIAGGFKNFLYNEWTRMGGMDYSDVGYDTFLINGKNESQLADASAGDRIRVRLINAAASTYFYVSLGQPSFKVIAADGIDIKPNTAKEVLMGMAETYDLLFDLPESKNYELKITAQDGTGTASAWIGHGDKVFAPVRPKPDLYTTMNHESHNGHHTTNHDSNQHASTHGRHNNHANHDNEASPVETLTVDNLAAVEPTEFKNSDKAQTVKLVLGGDMSRYVWHINGKAIHQDRTIEIQEGDVVRFIFENQTMMHHPMHLHGHFFRVLNKNGVYSPLKHTVDVPPHETRTIEFLANEPGEWMLHCHNLYHLKTGMARVVKYLTYKPSPALEQLQKHDPHLHDHWYFYGNIETSSNHGRAFFRTSQTWNQLELRFETANIAGKHFSFKDRWDYEGDLFYRRWFSRYFNIIGGGATYGNEHSIVAGIGYRLPFLIDSNVIINHRGKLRIDLQKRFQWTQNIFTNADLSWRPDQYGEHPIEYELSLMYGPSWYWALGLMFTNDSLGGGVEFNF